MYTYWLQVGRTPFHNAAFFGRKNVVRVMIDNGMKLGSKDKVRRIVWPQQPEKHTT